jgi:DNA-binding transcriptional LysR family regulator
VDRLEAMSILVTAVEAGSLTAASRKLGVPLPTVSRKVSELEAHLNTRLLIRTTRKLSLSDAGVAYVAACRNILEQVGDAERVASGEYVTPRGELVVTAPVLFGRLHVLPAISEFLALYPEIDIRLALSDRNAHLIDDQIDLAVRIGALPDSGAMATRVGGVRNVVCASPGHLASRGRPQSPGDLAGFSCINFDALSRASNWDFVNPTSKTTRSVAVQCRLSVNTAEAAIDAAVAGVGITRVLSYQADRAVSEGRLLIVLAEFELPELPVNLLHAAQGQLPLKTRRFLDFLAPRLRKTLSRPT